MKTKKYIRAVVCAAAVFFQTLAMDRGITEIQGKGQNDMGCKNGCTAFAFTAAAHMLRYDINTFNRRELNRIAGQAAALYRAHPQNHEGNVQLEADEALVSAHNQQNPENRVRIDHAASVLLATNLDRVEPHYTKLDALFDTMQQLAYTAVVITMKINDDIGTSFALGYDHGTWIFYDSHYDHVHENGSYACVSRQRMPDNLRDYLPRLKSTNKNDCDNISYVFLRIDGAAASQPEHLPADEEIADKDDSLATIDCPQEKSLDELFADQADGGFIDVSNDAATGDNPTGQIIDLGAPDQSEWQPFDAGNGDLAELCLEKFWDQGKGTQAPAGKAVEPSPMPTVSRFESHLAAADKALSRGDLDAACTSLLEITDAPDCDEPTRNRAQALLESYLSAPQ